MDDVLSASICAAEKSGNASCNAALMRSPPTASVWPTYRMFWYPTTTDTCDDSWPTLTTHDEVPLPTPKLAAFDKSRMLKAVNSNVSNTYLVRSSTWSLDHKSDGVINNNGIWLMVMMGFLAMTLWSTTLSKYCKASKSTILPLLTG